MEKNSSGTMDKVPLVNATEVTPVAGSTVEVVAPMDLQEGYELQIQVNGERKSVLVPPGGVRQGCLLYTSPSPRDQRGSRMPSSA